MLLKGLVLTACGLLALSVLGESEYYTWIDENGVTNYAEKMPPGSDARLVTRSHPFGYRAPDEKPQQVDETATAVSGTAAESPVKVDPDRLIADEKAKLEATLAEKRQFNCDVGKKNLVRLETYGRIKIRDEDGNERIMTPEEMDTKKAESRTLIQENCTG